MIAQVISTLKWITLGVIVFGEKAKIWDMIGMAPPSAYRWSQQNKIVACMGVFFLSNAIENALIQTGAFEVELNGMPVWSKLKTGRVPQGSELFEIIENQLHLSSNIDNKFPREFKVPDVTQEEPVINDKHEDNEKSDFEPVDGDGDDDDDDSISSSTQKYEDEFSEIDRETEEEKQEERKNEGL